MTAMLLIFVAAVIVTGLCAAISLAMLVVSLMSGSLEMVAAWGMVSCVAWACLTVAIWALQHED